MNKILAAWAWNGPVSSQSPMAKGISTRRMLSPNKQRKTLYSAKINTDTFKDPDGLMENICGVTDFLREKAKQRGADRNVPRSMLR